jgi:hypothetical protein
MTYRFRSFAQMPNAERIYTELGGLVEVIPDLTSTGQGAETLQWLGRAYALVNQIGIATDRQSFASAMDMLAGEPDRFVADKAAGVVRSIVYRCLAMAESQAPPGVRGSYIPAGNAFDAMTAVGKVLRPATSSAMIIDPYMDEKALTDFGALLSEGIQLNLLSDAGTIKPTLKPASERWLVQYGASRPLEIKLAPARALHDRLVIIDNQTVWILTRSLNAFATRAPAAIVRVDRETAQLKIAAYGDIWSRGQPL